MRNFYLKIIVTIFILLPICVSADESHKIIINDNNVPMTSETYNNLRKIYSEKAIQVMTQEKFENIMNLNLDFDTVQSSVAYYKTEYNNITGEVINTKISQSEYDSVDPNDYVNNSKSSSFYETSYKRYQLTLIKDSNTSGYIMSSVIWRIMPLTRSFDVNAIRYSNITRVNGSQNGMQIYTENGTNHSIYYSWNGTNINNQTKGFGISMNLVNNTVTYLESIIDVSVGFDGFPAGVYGTYQHAKNDVTLAQSKSYTLDAGGLGGVLLFSGTIGSNYDGMNGLYEYVN